MSRQKNSILINKHLLDREPVISSIGTFEKRAPSLKREVCQLEP